jgi:hypothetical protein
MSETITESNTVNTISAPALETTVTLSGTHSSGDVITFDNLGPLSSTIYDEETNYSYILDTTSSSINLAHDGDVWRVTDKKGVTYGYDALATLISEDPQSTGEFGFAVAISADGTRAVVGAPDDLSAGTSSGAAYVFVRSGASWNYEDTLLCPTPRGTGDQFGESVAISADGSRVAVGAPFKTGTASSAGVVTIFLRTGTSWSEEEVINDIAALGDQFGRSVSLSADASRLIIGTPFDDEGISSSGTVHVFSRSGTTWSLEQTIPNPSSTADRFGFSCKISATGDRFIAGSHLATGGGKALIFTRNDTTWTLEETLDNPTVTTDQFGYSVSMTALGDRVIIGAILAEPGSPPETDAGITYIYSRLGKAGTNWILEATIENPEPESGDNFGNSVDISADGMYAIIGTNFNEPGSPPSPPVSDTGSVYLYSRTGTTWSFDKVINNPEIEDGEFGNSVGMSADGSRIIVGSYKNDAGSPPVTEAGKAYIF